jgi:lipopolysaccharide/colanic/teichoic acid biosynthesis glycosyltransferase
MVTLIGTAQRLPVNIKVIPDLFTLALVQANAVNFANIPVIDLRPPVIVGSTRLVKRLFDMVVSAVLLLLAAPFSAAAWPSLSNLIRPGQFFIDKIALARMDSFLRCGSFARCVWMQTNACKKLFDRLVKA